MLVIFTSCSIINIQVDGTNLEGNGPTIEVVIKKAHLFFDPIPGDMLETIEDTPQVTVAINGISSKLVLAYRYHVHKYIYMYVLQIQLLKPFNLNVHLTT